MVALAFYGLTPFGSCNAGLRRYWQDNPGGDPAWLKTRFNTNEIGLMLTYVGLLVSAIWFMVRGKTPRPGADQDYFTLARTS